MKKLLVIVIIALFLLSACSGSNVPAGLPANAWNTGYNALQILDDWEDNGDNPNEDGIAVKITKQAEKTGFSDALFMKHNRSDQEEYIVDMYTTLFLIGGFKKGEYYNSAVFNISPDGQLGSDDKYDRYYELKATLVNLLQIEYEEDYTLLGKR